MSKISQLRKMKKKKARAKEYELQRNLKTNNIERSKSFKRRVSTPMLKRYMSGFISKLK